MSGTVASEDELIETYLAPLARGTAGAMGLKDDCAVLTPAPGTELVISTDAVAAGVHFLPDDPPQDIAWKALAVNVSDLAAKAAKPLCYQMALSFPDAPTHAFMQRFTAGLAEAQAAFGIGLSGGDTDRRAGPMTVTITAVGEIQLGFRLTRSNARAGDALFVTGTLGDAAHGLKLCRGDADALAWPLADEHRAHLALRYRRPIPRLQAGDLLRRFATSSMDLSDGLAKDLGRLASASGVGAVIEQDCLPLSPALEVLTRSDGHLTRRVLTGGDDYEILFTAAAGAGPAIAAWSADARLRVTQIGEITSAAGLFLHAAGDRRPLQPDGWDHF